MLTLLAPFGPRTPFLARLETAKSGERALPPWFSCNVTAIYLTNSRLESGGAARVAFPGLTLSSVT